MKTYELTYIISSSLSPEEAMSEAKDIESFTEGKGGVVLNSEKAVASVLAYPIKKHSSGFLGILTFNMLSGNIKELKEKLEKNKNVLRHLLLIKKPVRELKKRRTKKTSTFNPGVSDKSSVFKNPDSKKESGKIDLDKIDKKIDEIFS